MTDANHALLVVPNEETVFFRDYDALVPRLPDDQRPIAEAFRFSLESVTRILSVPYRVAHLSLYPDFRESLSAKAREAWNSSSDSNLLRNLQAKTDALQALNEELDKETIPKFLAQARERAAQALGNEQVGLGVRELFLQALVLIWSGFEVVAHDLFVWWMNKRPSDSLRLAKDQQSKKYVRQLRFDLSTLDEEGFDLSGRMGELIARVFPLDSIQGIRAAYGALLPEHSAVQESLGDGALWLLAQRRNLIVHRGGVVDERFLRQTGETLKVGERLAPDMDELRSAMALALKSGLCLIEAVGEEASDSGLPPF